MRRKSKGFTLAELLIVVAVIAVLVAIAIPIFTSQLEKSREATDLANVRGAYAEVMAAAILEDETAQYNGNPILQSDGVYAGAYYAEVDLEQNKKGWTTDTQKLEVGDVSYSDEVHWLNEPAPNGSCKVYYKDGAVFLDWGGASKQNNSQAQGYKHIDKKVWDILDTSLQTFLKEHRSDYKWSFLRSGDIKADAFVDLLEENNIDLSVLDEAKSWTVYASKTVADTTKTTTTSNPTTVIYWSTVDAEKAYNADPSKFDSSGNSTFNVPVIGFNGTRYDVYATKLQKCNSGKADEYVSIAKISGVENNTATYEFETLEEAQQAYNVLLAEYNDPVKGGTVANWKQSLINAGYTVE